MPTLTITWWSLELVLIQNFKLVQGMPFIFILYVDNLFFASSETMMIESKRELAFEFEMKDCEI